MIAVAPLLPLAIIFSFLATLFLREYLLKQARLDIPNERSMHKAPVPRGGGLAVISVILVGLVYTGFVDQILMPYFQLALATLMLVAVSWIDDKRGLPPALRLGFHALAALIGCMALPEDTQLFGGYLPFWLDRTFLVLGWAWFMNLYNFMDGIDGITCVQSISVMMGAGLLMSVVGIGSLAAYALMILITGACLGFLLHNWNPASIFLGDVGSVPLGFLIGFVLLSLLAEGYPWPALLLPLYYLADSGLTLIKRAIKGEKIWQAHRQHFYQRATLATGRHDKTVIQIGLFNMFLVVAALVATDYPLTGITLGLATVAYLLFSLNKTASHPTTQEP